jgi:hypothetical protein
MSVQLTTPNEKVLCPFCFKRYHPSECAVVSGLDGSELLPARTKMKEFFRKVMGQPLGGDLYDRLPRYQCPNPACLKVWPKDVELAENHIIAIVGATCAGITTYITSLIHALMSIQPAQQAMGVLRIGPLSEDVEKAYSFYHEELIVNHRAFMGTVPALLKGGIDPPLIYRLHFPPGAVVRRPVYLYFYEKGGYITEEQSLVEYSKYLFHASAIIFLADPFCMPNIKKHIHKAYWPMMVGRTHPADILYNLVKLYESRLRAKLTISIAVTVSKSDMLRFADPNKQTCLFDTPGYCRPDIAGPLRRQEWEQEWQRVDQDTRRILQLCGEGQHFAWLEPYEKVSFFAMAATGHPPTPGTCDYPGFDPIRVLDPLLWGFGSWA